jgi:NADH-quinone oxidoreductase subunit H
MQEASFTWLLAESGIKAVAITQIILVLAALEVWLERRVAAFIQNRIGPNRVGPFGLLQPIADVVKLFMKEDLVPKAAHQGFHRLAPALSLTIAFAVYAVIPFADYVMIAGHKVSLGVLPDSNIGLLYVLAMTSIGVYGITLAGWSSNSKYSLLGGLRSAAQMISYELTMGLALIGVVMMSETLSLNGIIHKQAGSFLNWNIWYQPLGFLLFLTSSFAETNRAPFDLPEAEPELVGGFNTEYSGMKFGMFFLAEYANMATASGFLAILYFGGYNLPFPQEWLPFALGSVELALIQFACFALKVALFIFFFVWVRWTVPRFRYDQLMALGWKIMLPLAIVNLLITGFIIMLFK